MSYLLFLMNVLNYVLRLFISIWVISCSHTSLHSCTLMYLCISLITLFFLPNDWYVTYGFWMMEWIYWVINEWIIISHAWFPFGYAAFSVTGCWWSMSELGAMDLGSTIKTTFNVVSRILLWWRLSIWVMRKENIMFIKSRKVDAIFSLIMSSRCVLIYKKMFHDIKWL